MITEDYCSFELAKLLKEKGFNEPCYRYYDDKGDICGKFINPDIPFNYSLAPYYLCPSQSMGMKWLRETHHLNIEPYFEYLIGYSIDVKYTNKETNIKQFKELRGKWFETYEEAVEAALKYCLKNLI